MLYYDFKGTKLSALGMGTMRLPLCGNLSNEIDIPKSEALFDLCMQRGINYYDTAWGYHNGASESVVGKLLSRYPRESYYLASKFPGYDLANIAKIAEIFPRQLEKCGVDYFDFYLFHNVTENNIDAYLDPANGILDYLLAQKAAGRIRHLGFSCHGKMPVLRRFLEAYGEHIEFCQLQVNYIDWTFQDAKEKVEYVSSLGIPVWVMEPVRGGKLAKLEPEYEERLKALRPDESTAAWAFRFLQSIPGVALTLSGMTTMEQLCDNLATYESAKPLNEEEMQTVLSIAEQMMQGVPCTSCRYCTEHCPLQLDIPTLLQIHNKHFFYGTKIPASALQDIPQDKWPDACWYCGSCMAVCPQDIRIPQILQKMAEKLPR